MTIEGGAGLRELAQRLEGEVGVARKGSDLSGMITLAASAVARLEAGLAAALGVSDDDTAFVLKAAKRIGYNAAADVYPGWEVGGAARTEADLVLAGDLARRSGALVERLGQGAMQRGNAVWLIGALDLARGLRGEAGAAFGRAAAFYDEAAAPEMALMARGYGMIAAGEGGFDGVLVELNAMGSEDAAAMREQLVVARAVFGG